MPTDQTKLSAIEELVAAPLPEMIKNLGLAVAEANRGLAEGSDKEILFSIPKAEIELNVAISINQQKETSVGGKFELYGFSVNAAYKSTYGFDEKASSRILIELCAKPREKAAS